MPPWFVSSNRQLQYAEWRAGAYLDSTCSGLGQLEAPHALLSQGRGKLTAGRTGASNWAAELNYGPANEWVG
jgi:hypothetical protein